MMGMDEEKLVSRKRLEKWIKIFLGFLAFVWLCTIISKSIYVSKLTIVKTDTPSKKYVEHIVETDGIVITGGEIAVNAQAGLRVEKLYVMQGDEVRAGDVLFTIDLADVADIIRAKETELSRLQYNLSDVQVNAVIDSQKKEVALLWAQEDYETADKETSIAKGRAKEALDKAEAELGKHLADTVPYTSDSARRDAWDDYHNWVNKGYSISDQITAKEREIQDLKEQLAELEMSDSGKNGQTAENVLSGAAGDVSSVNATDSVNDSGDVKIGNSTGTYSNTGVGSNTNISDNIQTDKGTGSKDTNNNTTSDSSANGSNNADNKGNADHNSALNNSAGGENNADSNTTLGNSASDKNAPENNTATENDADSNTTSDNSTDDNKDTDNSTGADNNARIPSEGDNENQDSADENAAERTDLQNKIKQADKELLTLRDALTKHDRNMVAQPDYSVEELKYDEWQNTRLALEANVQKAKENYNDISYNREVTLRQKQRDIAAAQVTTRADSTAELYAIDIGQIQAQLANLYTLQKRKGEIKAENDGIISQIQVAVGGRTSDMAAILMTDTQRPCQFKFSITKEQGKYIHLNDTVLLKLNGQSDTEVTVDYFTENMQGGYDLICMLPEGMGKPGLSGSIQKSVQGEYHDLALPVDAVFGEQGSYYIYTLNEKEGILGSEYYAEKIKIQLKDINDRYAALEAGTISADTRVITYASKELKQGESVRPQEK